VYVEDKDQVHNLTTLSVFKMQTETKLIKKYFTFVN